MFALAIQLVLSFGHVHVSAASSKPAALALNAAHAPDGGKPHRGSHRPDDLCAICIASGLIGSAQIASPPVEPAPTAVAATILSRTAEAAPTGQSRAAFRSRAPPLV